MNQCGAKHKDVSTCTLIDGSLHLVHPWASLHPNAHLVHQEGCPKRPSAHALVAVHPCAEQFPGY